jgi:hypothetical protein
LTNAASDTVQIYNSTNPFVILNSNQTSINLVNGTQTVIALNHDDPVPAGASKTYTIVVDTSGLTTPGNSFQIDLTNTGASFGPPTAATANSWAWNDGSVANQGTGSETFLNGYLFQNLPLTGTIFTE